MTIACVYAFYLQEEAPLKPLPKAELHYRCLVVDGVDIALGDTVTIEVSYRQKQAAVEVGGLVSLCRMHFRAQLVYILPDGLRNWYKS